MKAPRVLSERAIEVVGQLFVYGPTWDGDLASKMGRDEIVDAGLAVRRDGWQWLTEDGVFAAIEFGKRAASDKWRGKAFCR
jgi:hypothetical protein